MIMIGELRVGDEIVYVGQMELRPCLTAGKTYKVERVYQPAMPEHGEKHAVICCDGYDGEHEHFIYETDSKNFRRFIQQNGGWIGVDLDGTLAVYDRWRGPYHIGEPIMPMVRRVQAWLDAGRCVKIFTARMTARPLNEDGTEHDLRKVADAIQDWCYEHIGTRLEVTNVKDWHMMELWDDRAVQVRPNTGLTLAEELEAIRSAEAGKVATA